MSTEFNQKMAVRDQALDASGIGHNVEARLSAVNSAIAVFIGAAVRRCYSQLHYDQLVNVPTGIAPVQTPEELVRNPQRILMTALPGVIGEFVKWDITDAREFCFRLLEDVNDHQAAAEFKQQFLP